MKNILDLIQISNIWRTLNHSQNGETTTFFKFKKMLYDILRGSQLQSWLFLLPSPIFHHFPCTQVLLNILSLLNKLSIYLLIPALNPHPRITLSMFYFPQILSFFRTGSCQVDLFTCHVAHTIIFNTVMLTECLLQQSDYCNDIKFTVLFIARLQS